MQAKDCLEHRLKQLLRGPDRLGWIITQAPTDARCVLIYIRQAEFSCSGLKFVESCLVFAGVEGLEQLRMMLLQPRLKAQIVLDFSQVREHVARFDARPDRPRAVTSQGNGDHVDDVSVVVLVSPFETSEKAGVALDLAGRIRHQSEVQPVSPIEFGFDRQGNRPNNVVCFRVSSHLMGLIPAQEGRAARCGAGPGHRIGLLESEHSIWRPWRSKAFKVALAGVVLSSLALIFLYQYQPSPIPEVAAEQKGKLDPGLFGALETCLETLLAIAAISLIFEILLRQDYARTLRRFLRLGESLVRSGLQDLRRNPEIEWRSIIEPASSVTALVRDPSQWLIPSLSHIIAAAEKRTINVTIGLPDPTGASLPVVAETVGLDGPTLKQNIETAVKTMENQWKAQKPHLKKGSAIRVVTYTAIPLNEVLAADDITVCLVAQSINQPIGEWQMGLVLQQREDQYPSNLLRQALEGLDGLNELWAGDTR